MKRILVVLALLALVTVGVFAQIDSDSHQVTMNVVAIAAIGLNDTGLITLTTTDPLLPGQDPQGDTDVTKVLFYTALNASGLFRIITVNWGALDAAPAGTSLSVAADAEAGAGTDGSVAAISNVAQNLVTAIPSVATGRGAGDGAALTYTFNVDNAALLQAGDSETVTVTYTLTDDA